MKSRIHSQKRFTPGQFLGALAALFLGIVAVAYAVTLPNTFTSGTAISSSQVNANFAALKVAVDALETKVNTLGSNKPVASRKGLTGYAWANQPAAASYTPEASYSFNSSGGAITATRSGAGVYQIIFTGLGSNDATAGGHVQVTAYSTGAYCRTAGWSSLNADASINISCFTSAGAAVDSEYDVLFVN